MSIKDIIRKIPYKNRVFWLCLCFAIIYTALGWRMADTLVYDYDGLLFHADTAEVAEDITKFQTRNHGDTNVHPLYVLFVNPLGAVLNSFLPVTAAIILINTLFGTLTIWIAYHCFRLLGLPRHQSTLWTILTGCTASNLLFVSIPERHIAASLSITLMCFFCIKYPGKVGRFIWIGLLTFGVTITNFLQCGIMFFASVFNRYDNEENPFPRAIKKTIRFGLVTLALAIALSLIQKQIWPDTRYFFLPEVYAEETRFFHIPTNSEATLLRFLNLSAHMFVFNIVAPTPFIDLTSDLAPLGLGLKSLGSFRHIGWISIAGWTLLLSLGFYLVLFRKHNKWFWLQMGIHGCLLFNAIMHMIYGDDFFLYTANWTFLLIVMVASATVAANKSRGFRITIETLLTLMITAMIINNALFINNVSNYFRYGSSMKWQTQHGKQWETAKMMEQFLVKQQIHTLFSGNRQKWFAYATNQKIKVVNVPNERSPSLKQDAELMSDNYAFLYDVGDVISFITNSIGSYTKTSLDDFDFYHGLIPPLGDLSPVSGEDIVNIRTSCNTNSSSAVVDLNLDTQWTGDSTPGEQNWIEFSFAEKKQVSCIKLFSQHGDYPRTWQIEVRETPTNDWEAVTASMNYGEYFWSGPRIFWSGKHHHLEARILPMLISQMRLVFPATEGNSKTTLSEVMIYGPGEPLPSEVTALPLLIEELREKKIKRLYSERWAANAVYSKTSAMRGKARMKIETLLEPYVFQQKRSRPQPKIDKTPYPVSFSKNTAILVKVENAKATRYCLNKRGYKMRETTIDPWILFDFRDSEWKKNYTGYSKLYWGGISCFLAEPNGASKQWAKKLTRQARRTKAPDKKESLLVEALSFYPKHQGALQDLEQLLRAIDMTEKADVIQNQLTLLRKPKIKAPIQFEKKITLSGVSFNKGTFAPGDKINIRYYWTCKPDKDNPYAVFVHFQNENETIFQGDHDFGHGYSNKELLCQADGEVFVENLTHSVPLNAPQGDYQTIIGVYDRRNMERLKAKTNYDKKHDAVVLPVTFRVK